MECRRRGAALLFFFVLAVLTTPPASAGEEARSVFFLLSPVSSGERPEFRNASQSPSTRARCSVLCAELEAGCSRIYYAPSTRTCVTFATRFPDQDSMTSDPAFQVYIRQPPEAVCPVGQGYAFSAPLRLCLKANTEVKVTWAGAKAACQTKGEQLAVVKSLEEELFVREYLQRIGFAHVWGTPTYKALMFRLEGRVTGNDNLQRAFMCQKKNVLF